MWIFIRMEAKVYLSIALMNGMSRLEQLQQQAYSHPRDWRVSASWGPNVGPPGTPRRSQHYGIDSQCPERGQHRPDSWCKIFPFGCNVVEIWVVAFHKQKWLQCNLLGSQWVQLARGRCAACACVRCDPNANANPPVIPTDVQTLIQFIFWYGQCNFYIYRQFKIFDTFPIWL